MKNGFSKSNCSVGLIRERYFLKSNPCLYNIKLKVSQNTQPLLLIKLSDKSHSNVSNIWSIFLSCIPAAFENRFKNALVSVAESTSAPGFGTTNSATKCHYRAGTQGFIRYYQCSEPMYGRYVRITGVNQNDYLNFYEVEVHGWY